MRSIKRLMILAHRYIGIPLSFMFVVWFVSAFFMIYTGGMPRITPDMQIDGASALDFTEVRITPEQAAATVGYTAPQVSLRQVLGRPVYEFAEPGYPSLFIHADNGTYMDPLDEQQSLRLASEFLAIPAQQLRPVAQLQQVDQWTMTESRDLPFYKFAADDGLGTEVYVSPENAKVVVYTTSRSRALAWLGTIPHWLYFASLRLNQPLWYDVVIWLSALGSVLALLGLVLAVTQWRRTRPFTLQRAIPYRGLLRWHYILGALFGVIMLTWVFSGLLSMEPFAWTRDPGVAVDRQVLADGSLDLAAFPSLREADWQGLEGQEIKRIDFQWLQGAPYLLANYSAPRSGLEKRDRLHQPYNIAGQFAAESRLYDAHSGAVVDGFDQATLVAKLDAAVSTATVTEVSLLQGYDDYYYSRQGQLALPVLRVAFDDPGRSWIYVDPERSQVLAVISKWSRLERWLYNGLHSLDFAFWYHQRPLWDIGVILLLLGGLGLSVFGLVVGVKRLVQDLRALVARLKKGARQIPSHQELPDAR